MRRSGLICLARSSRTGLDMSHILFMRSEERFSRNAETEIVCRLLLEKKRVNRAKKSGMVNITSSVNRRERRGINTILHALNPLFTINVTIFFLKNGDH